MGVSAKRNARIEITADARGVAPGIADARRQVRTFQREQSKGSKQQAREDKRKAKDEEKSRAKLKSGAKGLAGNVAGGFGTALGFDAAGGVAGMVGDVMDFTRALTRFQILSGKTPEQMNALRASILGVSNATGISANEVLAGASTYVDLTGDVDGATTAMGSFTKIAQASGASIADVSTAAAAMQDAMKLNPKDFEATFSGLITQGKAGAVGLKDFAGEFSSLLPKFARFKGNLGAEGIMQLGAAFQVARHGFGDASEAATGLESMMGALSKNAGNFEDAGVRIFDTAKDGTKTFRNLHDIVVDIGKSKLAKDPEALSKAFGRKEAEATYNQLARLPGLYDQMIDAGKDAGSVQRDFDTYMASSSGKMEQAWIKIKNAVATALTPELIQKFADAIGEAADRLTPLVEGMSKIGTALGALYGVGRKVSGALFGDKPKEYNHDDQLVLGQYGSGMQESYTYGMKPDEIKNRQQSARRNMADVDAYNSTASTIMGGENDDRVTPESINRAIAATLTSRSMQNGGIGEAQAGHVYLNNAGYTDDKINEMVQQKYQAALGPLVTSIANAVREGMASANVTVGAETAQKGIANSKNHRRGQF